MFQWYARPPSKRDNSNASSSTLSEAELQQLALNGSSYYPPLAAYTSYQASNVADVPAPSLAVNYSVTSVTSGGNAQTPAVAKLEPQQTSSATYTTSLGMSHARFVFCYILVKRLNDEAGSSSTRRAFLKHSIKHTCWTRA